MRRRHLAALALLMPGASPAQPTSALQRADHMSALQRAMARARELRDAAQRAGDQPYGAVVLRGETIVGEAPSRVVTATDPTAHAEMEALRDAARRLASRDLSGCVLVSTSRPCRMCEAAAGWARIERMVHGDALTDAGRPS
jgi:tRNA(Arg) A34 adenosine deaminase TadA